MVVIEKKVISVSLNGYPIDAWQGARAKNIDISVLVSSASSTLIHTISEISKDILQVSNTFFHSSLILHYAFSRNLVPSASSHVCVHVHEEITDIISIDKAGSVYFASFPVGTATVERRVASAMKIHQHTAESILALYSDLHLDQIYNRKIGVVIERVINSWSHDYHSFIKVSGISSHPQAHIFVSAPKYLRLFTRLTRIPNSHATVEALTDDLYPKAIHSLA